MREGFRVYRFTEDDVPAGADLSALGHVSWKLLVCPERMENVRAVMCRKGGAHEITRRAKIRANGFFITGNLHRTAVSGAWGFSADRGVASVNGVSEIRLPVDEDGMCFASVSYGGGPSLRRKVPVSEALREHALALSDYYDSRGADILREAQEEAEGAARWVFCGWSMTDGAKEVFVGDTKWEGLWFSGYERHHLEPWGSEAFDPWNREHGYALSTGERPCGLLGRPGGARPRVSPGFLLRGVVGDEVLVEEHCTSAPRAVGVMIRKSVEIATPDDMAVLGRALEVHISELLSGAADPAQPMTVLGVTWTVSRPGPMWEVRDDGTD